MNLYPLRFEPLLRRYIWGGRRLETLLGKSLPAGEDFAESWELVDHQQGQRGRVVVHPGLERGARAREGDVLPRLRGDRAGGALDAPLCRRGR